MKNKIFILVFVLIFIAGGFFLWKEVKRIEKEEEHDWSPIGEVSFEPPENYLKTETDQGQTMIENENIGFSFAVPQNWTAKIKEKDRNMGFILLISDDSVIDPETKISKKGCGATVWVGYSENESQILKKFIDNFQKESETIRENKEIIKIDNRSALKKFVFDNPKIGKGVVIKLPVPSEDRIYHFETIFPPGYKQRCREELSNFLNGVSIKGSSQ